MIKAAGTAGGKPLMIVGGETEESVAEELRNHGLLDARSVDVSR